MKHLDINDDLLCSELCDFYLFNELSLSEILALVPLCEPWLYDPGETIILEGTKGQFLYAILGGSISVVKNIGAQSIEIGKIHQGDILGETSLFKEIERTASAIAITDVALVTFSRSCIIDYINQYPKAGIKLFGSIAKSLLKKLDTADKHLVCFKEEILSADDFFELEKQFPIDLMHILKSNSSS